MSNSQSVLPLEWGAYSELAHHSSETNDGWFFFPDTAKMSREGLFGVLEAELSSFEMWGRTQCLFKVLFLSDTSSIWVLSWDCETRACLNLTEPNPHLVKSERAPCMSRDLHPRSPWGTLEGASGNAGIVKVQLQSWDVEGSRGCRWAGSPLLSYSFSPGGTLDCHHSKHSDQSSGYAFLAKDGLGRPWCHLMGFLHYSVSDSLIVFLPLRRKY